MWKKKKLTKEEDILKIRLIEYEKAQDSAEHYNNMIWTLMSLGIATSLIILHIFWTNRPEILYSLFMLFAGAFILFYFSYLIENANEKKEWKYKICKEIEKDYEFKGQNLGTEKLPISNSKWGMKIFRVMKFILFFIYAITIITGLGSAVIENKTSCILIWATIIILLAIVGYLLMEIYYIRVSKNE